MKYTREERLDIGRRVYRGELNRFEAAAEYGISEQTARDYMRLYRDANALPPKRAGRPARAAAPPRQTQKGTDALKDMSREELIQELVKARITEARLKKGYEKKGDGTVIRYGRESIR